jgi:hypothetical protein
MHPSKILRTEPIENRLKKTETSTSASKTLEPRQILRTILRDAVVERDHRIEGGLRFFIAYGTKNLELFFHPDLRNFTTIVTTDHAQTRQPHETTYVYLAAKKFMIAISEKKKMILTYDLVTENDNLIKWANSTGKILFDWEEIKTHEPQTAAGKLVYQFTTRFQPKIIYQAA